MLRHHHAVRVALLSDTHGFLDPRVAEVVRGCDAAVHAGDVMGGAVLDELRPARGPVVAVRGNNDTRAKWPDSEQARLAALGLVGRLSLPGGELVVVHGHRHEPARRRHARLRREFAGAGAVVYGHSHFLTMDLDDEPWVVNPGAAGRVRTHGGPSCMILMASREGWHIESRRFEPLNPSRKSKVIKSKAKGTVGSRHDG